MIMHIPMTSYDWWLVGRYGGALVIAGALWLTRQRWFPHRHDGWMTLSGHVHKCSHCGKLPAGANSTPWYLDEPQGHGEIEEGTGTWWDTAAQRRYLAASHADMEVSGGREDTRISHQWEQAKMSYPGGSIGTDAH
jgi:hypothetical protein